MKLSTRDKDILRRLFNDLAITPRPPAGPMRKAGALKFQHLTISLPPDLLVRVRASGMKMSQTIEKLLRFYLEVMSD